jgi:hypothetical protein
VSIPQDDPYVDVICDAESHDRPVSLDRFVYNAARALADEAARNSSRGWRWEKDRNRGTTSEEAAGKLPRMFLPIKRDTAVELPDGRRKVSLDCPQCGLHLPIRWEHWTSQLDAMRHAGKDNVGLPALVATLTK